MKFYLNEGGETSGPFEAGELLRRPGFGKDSLVCPLGATGGDAWKPAGSFADFGEAFARAVPTAPERPPAAAAVEPELPSPAEKLVLVIDDDESIRAIIEMELAMEGFRVVTAINGLDGSAKLKRMTPDLIVTDLMMPNQGGYEFLRSLQAAGNGRIPVIVVTGSVLNDSTIGVIRQEANVVEFMEKPLRMHLFILALHKHLKTRPSSPRSARRKGEGL